MDLERIAGGCGGVRQLVDRRVDLVGDQEIEAEHVVRRLARAPAIDPAAVLQLVALPGLADGEAGEQREQRAEEDDVSCPSRLRQMRAARTSSQRSCARSTSSMNSRTAPRPPGAVLTQSTRSRTSGAASAGAAESPARASTGRSSRSSPMYATSASFSACVAEDLLVRVELARHALRDDADRELRGALRVAPDDPRRQQADGQARRAAPRRSRRRRGCGSPWTRCRRRA